MDWPFFATMVATWMFATKIDDRRMLGTASILILNWMACSAFVLCTGDPYNAKAFAAFDWTASLAIFTPLVFSTRPSAWQGAVGMLYAGELICHGAREWIGTPAAIYYGWYFLRYAAWAQVLVVLVWGAYEMAFRRALPDRRAPDNSPFPICDLPSPRRDR